MTQPPDDAPTHCPLCHEGRVALNEWRDAQPKPKVKKRRQSKAFAAWRNYEEAFNRISFSNFLKLYATSSFYR